MVAHLLASQIPSGGNYFTISVKTSLKLAGKYFTGLSFINDLIFIPNP